MAQVENTSRRRSDKGRKVRKALFVDLTPMVDLAFLLITFFMLTTAMMKPQAMELLMPKTDSVKTDVPMSRVITFIAIDENQLLYYFGEALDELKETNYSPDGMRSIIYEKENELVARGDSVICLIKLSEGANYENMVDMLDEMVITDVPTYAVQDLTENEKIALSQLKKYKQ